LVWAVVEESLQRDPHAGEHAQRGGVPGGESGRHNEHINPRVLDTWDGIPAHQPVQIAPGEFDLRDLVAGLTDPAAAAGIPLHEPAPGANGKAATGPVWQCSLRNDASDRILSHDEWRDIEAYAKRSVKKWSARIALNAVA
jgi:hypothetical protein